MCSNDDEALASKHSCEVGMVYAQMYVSNINQCIYHIVHTCCTIKYILVRQNETMKCRFKKTIFIFRIRNHLFGLEVLMMVEGSQLPHPVQVMYLRAASSHSLARLSALLSCRTKVDLRLKALPPSRTGRSLVT